MVVHGLVAEFDAAVHGAGVHEVDAFVVELFEACGGDAEDAVVFAQAGEILGVLAFHLDAQEVDDVGFPGHGLVVVGEAGDVFGSGFGDE